LSITYFSSITLSMKKIWTLWVCKGLLILRSGTLSLILIAIWLILKNLRILLLIWEIYGIRLPKSWNFLGFEVIYLFLRWSRSLIVEIHAELCWVGESILELSRFNCSYLYLIIRIHHLFILEAVRSILKDTFISIWEVKAIFIIVVFLLNLMTLNLKLVLRLRRSNQIVVNLLSLLLVWIHILTY
jgi:hypothetical protein